MGMSETRDYCDGYNQTLIQLLSNLEHVDFEFAQSSISFLAWFITQLNEEPDERVFASVALLYLCVKFETKISDKQLLTFARWIIAEEKKVVDSWEGGVGDQHYHWLLRTTFFNQHHKKWIALGAEMSGFLPQRRSGRCGAGNGTLSCGR